ncbi:putative Transcriptional regulator [[Clostridium] ultunense Esp]|uniref:helix-turn-helix domain-containing protein n=1 Tax=Thermicanus aegyptius TaxID=94009 RepID=UPI0002B709C3|nr:helix-turn-helix transcriptional regulator [Thermicanus aegyptius]CCQ93901.1 putative Transcriptional regulator [[Clostridium] ultunense Esp]
MNSIGKNIRDYRKKRGFTLEELADEICNPDTLWRIEKGHSTPSLPILEKISERLSIPIGFLLLPSGESPQMKDIQRMMDLCRELDYYEEYELLDDVVRHLKELVKGMRETPKSIYIYIKWYEAILMFRKEGDLSKAEYLLRELLSLSPMPITELEIGISNSLGLVLMKLSRDTEAEEIFLQALRSLEEIPYLKDRSLYPKIGYNLLSVWYRNSRYDDLLKAGYAILYDLIRNQILYQLGEYHHLLSLTHEMKGELREAINLMRKAVYIFYTEGRYELYVRALRALADVQLKNGEIDEGKRNLEKVEKELPLLPDANPMKKKIYEKLFETKRKYNVS